MNIRDIRDYCLDHNCNNDGCLFNNVCPFYMCGGTPPSDMSFEEATDFTEDLIKLGKILEEKKND